MKTCLTCNTSGISDNARYCPQCGAILLSSQWQKEYRELVKRQTFLEQQKDRTEQFANERTKVLALLEENEAYRSEKEAFCKVLSDQKNKRRLVKYIQFPLMIILLLVIMFWLFRCNTEDGIKGSLVFCFTVCMLGAGVYWITEKIEDKLDKIQNADIKKPGILEAFIQKNRAFYGLNDESNENDLQKILEKEVLSPETVSTGIAKLIEEKEQVIKEVESKLKALEELSTE